MEFTAGQIAELLKGTLEGEPSVKVNKLSKIEEAGPGSLTFLSHPKYIQYLESSTPSVVVINEEINPAQPRNITFIRVKDSREAFSKLLKEYRKTQFVKTGIDTQSSVSSTAKIGRNVYIGAFSYIGDATVIGDKVKIMPNVFIGDNCKIGEGCIINPGVRIYNDCILGRFCILHSGAVIGSDGFGFIPNNANNYQKMPQVGNVVLEDNIEIGANTTIDRATLGSTVIRKGVKLDNLIQVGHNVEIGENTVIAAQSGIAGSTKIGSDCMIGGQVGIIGHLTIGNRVKIAAQSGVGNDIPDDSTIQGSPAIDHISYKKSYVIFRQLPEWVKKLSKGNGG